MLDLDRREILKLAAVGALAFSSVRSAISRPVWRDDPFQLGVASGSPTDDSVVLWTRLLSPELPPQSKFQSHSDSQAAVAVQWELADDEKFTRIVSRGQSLALPALAYAVHVEVTGLPENRWFFYRFFAGNAVSPVGRTRTFPAPDSAANVFRLAYASCQRWEHGFFSAWRHMVDENLDAVMFLGDYVYEYPGAINAVRPVPGGWVQTLDDYRARYATYKSDPDLKAIHAHCPWLLSWDDHEVQNDYAGTQEGNGGPVPESSAPFALRRAAAYQAYYEHMPLRASVLTRAFQGLLNGAEMRIYSRFQFGRLASINLLDTRQYRDPQVCTRGGSSGASTVDPRHCERWNDPARSLLGANQERWLAQGLGRSKSLWNVMGQQTLFGARNLHTAAEPFFWNDGWDGYPVARTRLTQTLQSSAASNLVMLGGDTHENWVGHIKSDYSRSSSGAIGVEFCGTSISSRSGGNAKLEKQMTENPHFVFAEAQRKGYGVVNLTPRKLTTTLRVVYDVTQRDSGIETLAQFEVPSGKTVIERV